MKAQGRLGSVITPNNKVMPKGSNDLPLETIAGLIGQGPTRASRTGGAFLYHILS